MHIKSEKGLERSLNLLLELNATGNSGEKKSPLSQLNFHTIVLFFTN